MWFLIVSYVLWKYRFLAVTPELISRDVLGKMEDSVIVFNALKEIILVNDRTVQLLHTDGKDIVKKPVDLFIRNLSLIRDDIKDLFNGNGESFTAGTPPVKKQR
jgi:hypothetical protein